MIVKVEKHLRRAFVVLSLSLWVVVQLVVRLIRITQVRSSNPVIGIIMNLFIVESTKNKEKRPGMVHFKKTSFSLSLCLSLCGRRQICRTTIFGKMIFAFDKFVPMSKCQNVEIESSKFAIFCTKKF